MQNPASEAKANANAYIRLLLDKLAGRDPLKTMPELASSVENLVGGLSPETLHRPERPGKWSIAAVVQHLADTEIVYGYRIRKILADPGTEIAGYDQDAWSRTLRYDTAHLGAALAQLRAIRTANVALLSSLSPEEWERAGMHSERGPESVRQIARLIGGHDFVHLDQLSRIKQTLAS